MPPSPTANSLSTIVITQVNYIVRLSFKVRGKFVKDLIDDIDTVILIAGYTKNNIFITFN